MPTSVDCRRMEKITLEKLIEWNHDYQYNFGITEEELEIAQSHIDIVEYWHRNVKTPQVGDMVCGSFYNGTSEYNEGLICKLEFGVAEVCYYPYVPFVSQGYGKFSLSVSGGPFTHSHICMLEKVEDDVTRLFMDWGRNGAGPSQAFCFPVKVRKWKLVEPIRLCRDDWGDDTITYDIEGSELFRKVEIRFASKAGDTIRVQRKDGSWFKEKGLGNAKATIEFLEWKEKGGKA